MENLIIITKLEQLQELKQYLAQHEYIAVDTETTGVTKDSKVIGYSVSAELNIGYYVILSAFDKFQQKLIDNVELIEASQDFFKSLISKALIMHNAVFDCWMIENNFKVSLINSVHTDSLILGHLLDENRRNGLKELGVSLFGRGAKQEQDEMKASVLRNGGLLTKSQYELYKGDAELIAKYGAKDTLLTLALFYKFIPELYNQGLDKFFYYEESMPLLKGPTYELNTTGLRVDAFRLTALRDNLNTECLEQKAIIYKEIDKYIKDKYPATNKKNTFNIGSSKQLAWLLFNKQGHVFDKLTKGGKEVAKVIFNKVPYSNKDKALFTKLLTDNLGSTFTIKGKKTKIRESWNYFACDKTTLSLFNYKWTKTLLKYLKNLKLLNTYVKGIQERMEYGIIRPSFLQHGTTSGRYSSKNPNFQNLPRDDKRVKSCIVSRPGKVFVGADYSQLEPRVFASFSQDERLMACFAGDQDFYSVIGMEVFNITDAKPIKEGSEDAFGIKYKKYRDIAKVVALSATYGTTAAKMAPTIHKSKEEAQEIIDNYFDTFPKVKQLMLESHKQAKDNGLVYNLFGRPRRMPEALNIKSIYGSAAHEDLPYEIRNILNLAVNHRIQSTGASLMNRASIAFYNKIRELQIENCNIVLQVHDEIIVECKEEDAERVSKILKQCMELTNILPGVALEAIPKIAKDLAGLK